MKDVSMVKFTKQELRRQWINNRVQIEDGMRVDAVLIKMGPDAFFEREVGYYDDSDEWFVVDQRLETDEEYNDRLENLRQYKQELIDRIAANKAKKEAKDRREYLRLRKKFEGK